VWFILSGDTAVKSNNDFGSPLSKTVNYKLGDRRYLSPLALEAHQRGDSSIMHNPYKSDVFSLGLVLFELASIGVMDPQHF